MPKKKTKPPKVVAEAVKNARAARLKSLRRMTRLSRRAMEENYQVNESTLKHWEMARHNGLSVKGAKQVITAVKHEGLICSYEWLMHGVGVGPQFIKEPEPVGYQPDSKKLTEDIISELVYFRQHNRHVVDFVVADDAMEPRFVVGEYVAGIQFVKEHIQVAIGQDCIVQLGSGELLLRHVKAGDEVDRFTLVCSNANTSVKRPILYDVELISAAPVVWQRRSVKSLLQS